jgi:NAD(P)H-dependent FMN reductase
MLYKFKSKNAGDVIMLEPNGQRVLQVIGKGTGAAGIILAGEMAAAIAALQAAIALEESTQQAVDAEADAVHGDAPGLRQRAMPFIDMLTRNAKANTDVTWGV